MSAVEFPFVYRWRTPIGLRGQRCRRLTFPPTFRDRDGMALYHDGSEKVVIEFPDGRTEVVSRSAIVTAASKLGRMTVARIARGDKRPSHAQITRTERRA